MSRLPAGGRVGDGGAAVIEARIDDLAFVTAEAILRPIDARGDAVTPAGRRLEMQAGPGVGERLRGFGELPLGAATITDAGQLSVPFLISVVVQSDEESATRGAVERALTNGLRRATEWGIEVLALPPLGTGAGNLTAETAARTMVPVIRRHQAEAGLPASVVVVVENEYELDVFSREIERTG